MTKLKKKTLKMKNWAVVGATDDKSRFGYKIVKILKENDYNVYPVNPKKDKVAGIRCYNKLSEIENKIDVVDFVINPQIGKNIIEEVAELDIEYVWLQPGSRSDEIRDYAKDYNIKIIEDCIYATLK